MTSTLNTPSPSSAIPGADFVDPVTPRRFARLAVGTGMFNAMAIVVLAAISSFVVLSSGHAPLAHETAAAASEIPSPHRRPGVKTITTRPSTTTTTTAHAPVPTTTPPRHQATLTATPASTSTTTDPLAAGCSAFTDQPSAQLWFDHNPTALAALDGDHDGRACEQLPGGPTTTTTGRSTTVASIKTVSKADLLRPDTKLYGVHTQQSPLASEVSAFGAEAGKAPNMVMFFRDLDDDFPTADIASSWAEGALPMVTWEPIVKNSANGQPTMGQIASGVYDTQLTAWAQAAAAQNMAFVLRFGQEMNGNWYSWSDGLFGNNPGDYVAAWRHVHDLFDANGADQVIWNWSVNRIDTLPNKTLSRVYPGDDYVDWVGVSGYYRQDTGTTPSFDGTFGMTLGALHSVAPKKLVLLSEVGAGTTEANRVAWINDFFAQLLNHPEIIGFNWFNDFKSGGDWRIGYSTATEQAFAAGVADNRYGPLVP